MLFGNITNIRTYPICYTLMFAQNQRIKIIDLTWLLTMSKSGALIMR